MSLDHPRLYLVAPARLEVGPLAELVQDLGAAGVDLIQLREKDRSPEEIQELAAPILEACRSAGIPFIVNDHPEVAAALGADGVHVGQDDASVDQARRAVGGIVGLSTHSQAQIERATDLHPDYIAVGPVFETPTQPGRPSVGLDLLRFAASQDLAMPWFAIGGIDGSNIEEVLSAGARRVVVVRAITEADDPPAAAALLAAKLPG